MAIFEICYNFNIFCIFDKKMIKTVFIQFFFLDFDAVLLKISKSVATLQ